MKFEKLLGQPLSIFSKVMNTDFKKNETPELKIRLYSSKNYIEKDFYGMPNHHITLTVDDQNLVQSITVHFRKLINRQFYDSFNEIYGTPTSILVIDKRIVISESSEKDKTNGFHQNLRKSELKMREGSFDEKPLYIIWEKEHFKIIVLQRQQNLSELTFKKLPSTWRPGTKP